MKTVRFNKQALAVLAACFLFLFCVVSYFSVSESSPQNTILVGNRRVAVRDVENRRIIEERAPQPRVVQTVGQVETVVSKENVERMKPAKIDLKPPVEKLLEVEKVEKPAETETRVVKPPVQKNSGLETLIGKIHYEDKDEENG